MTSSQTMFFGNRHDLRDALTRVGPLKAENGRSFQYPCKICGTPSREFDHVDFNKYCDDLNCYKFGFTGLQVSYFRCTACGFLFTRDFDEWSPDDFRRYIYNSDYTKVDPEYLSIRPTHVGRDFARRLKGAEGARILDYGSGAGVFADILRQNGFTSVTSYDPFSSPARPTGQFDIITSFEVIEHTPDPLGTFADMRSLLHDDGCIIVSQTLQPPDILSIRGSWWYLAPRNGHVSTYTEECLEAIGRSAGQYFHRGDTVYAFVGPTPSGHAAMAAASIGPSFSTVKLFAPTALGERAILGPDRLRIAWHVIETDEGESFRWTGDYAAFDWQATWPEVERVRFAVPVMRPVQADFVAQSVFTLDGEPQPAALVRGALVADFDTMGRRTGIVRLETPLPDRLPAEGNRAVGLAVPIRSERDATGA